MIEDLEFLPFDSRRVDGGIEVTINDDVSLLLVPQPRTGELHTMTTIIIHSVRTTASLNAK